MSRRENFVDQMEPLPNRLRRHSCWSLGLALAMIAACSSSEGKTDQAGKPGGAGQAKGPPPALVKVAKVGGSNLTDRWAFLGQVKSALSTSLAAAVSGHVRKLDVRAGDKIKQGEVIVTLDPTRIGSRVAAARAKEQRFVAELAQAKRQLERIRQMKSTAFSAPEREKFELDVKSLQAQLAAQRAETRETQTEYMQHLIKAPFDGIVRTRHVNPGAWVNAGQPIIDIISLDQLEIFVDIAPELGRRLAKGHKATLRGSSEVKATIAGIVPALDESTRGMRIRLTPDSRPDWLMSGTTVNVEFAVDLAGKGVSLPLDALVRGPVSVRIVKVVEGKAVPVQVQVIATAGKVALVNGKGLAEGDTVVTHGNQRLRPGQPLRVIK